MPTRTRRAIGDVRLGCVSTAAKLSRPFVLALLLPGPGGQPTRVHRNSARARLERHCGSCLASPHDGVWPAVLTRRAERRFLGHFLSLCRESYFLLRTLQMAVQVGKSRCAVVRCLANLPQRWVTSTTV